MVSDNSKYPCVATLFCLHVLMFPGDKQYTQIVYIFNIHSLLIRLQVAVRAGRWHHGAKTSSLTSGTVLR